MNDLFSASLATSPLCYKPPAGSSPEHAEIAPNIESNIDISSVAVQACHSKPSAVVNRASIPQSEIPSPELDAQQIAYTMKGDELKAEVARKTGEVLDLIGPMNFKNAKITKLFEDAHSNEALEKLIDLLDGLSKTHKAGIAQLQAPAAEKAIPRQIKNGAVKQVWARDDVPTKAFYTALKGNSSATSELKKEVVKAAKIKQVLERNAVLDFVGQKIYPLIGEQSMGFLASFASVELLKNEIQSLDSHKEIPKEDLQKLKDYLNSDPGKIEVNAALARGSNLLMDIKEVTNEDVIEGNFTVITNRADGDLEDLIRDPTMYQPKDMLSICSQVVTGMADMHEAGYVHGDIKPENVLVTWVDGAWHARVSDFGKAEKMGDKDVKLHIGNTRFAPWENRLSKAGDVCSTGIKLIRILEQQVLVKMREKNPELENPELEIRSLIEPLNRGILQAANVKDKQVKGKQREGFEVFVIESKDFSAIEANHTRAQKVIARMMQGKNMLSPPSAEKLKVIESEKNRYIDALANGLKEMEFTDSEDVDKICNLIKSMTDTNVANRPTMQQADIQLKKLIKNMA